MQIDWWTLALQAVNFLVLVWLLRRFLYRPVREVIEKRKLLAEQAMAEADKRESAADAARERYEEDRAGLTLERQDALRKIHEQQEAEHRKLLDEAKQEAAEVMAAARESIAKEREVALADVRQQMAGLAVEIASELLRKAGSSASSAVYLEQLERQLKDMPADERERLERDLATDGARLTVVTATPLLPEERDSWTARLGACLAQGGETEFTTDPEILGGAELRFPHAVLKFTWAEQLRKARELLQADEAAS